MSKAIGRVKEDKAGGVILDGASRTYINGKLAARITSKVQGHGDGSHSSPKMVEGSSTVIVEGKGVSREGDKASCGHPLTPGSSNVFAG